MELSSLEDDVNGQQLFERARDFYNEDDYIKALEVIQGLSFVQGDDDKTRVNFLEGTIFKELADKTENTGVKVTYLLASVECFSKNVGLSAFCAGSLFSLAHHLGSVLYYEESLGKAKQLLYDIQDSKMQQLVDGEEDDLKYIIKTAESKIAESNAGIVCPVKICEEKEVRESEEREETRKSDSDFIKALRSYWVGLNLERKRNFMKVSTAELTSFVERIYGSEGRDALERVLNSAREDRKWKFWMCRTCSKKFSSPEECKNHLALEHAPEYKPSSSKYVAQMIGKAWARKISVGGWQPVDSVAAIEMIKNRFEDVKVFAYENGWSKAWPLAADEERSKFLHEIKLLLVSLCDHKILCCSIRDWVMHFLVKHLETLEVSKHSLIECHLMETPQSICFLECRELNQILDFLKNIKCESDDGTDLVCRVVDSFCNNTRVKEKIHFDPHFSFLLLDKRLLQCKIARFDDEGTINVVDPNVHYAKAHAHGDDILSWLAGYDSGDESFQFPKPIREHDLDIWVAVLRAVQFMCRSLQTEYTKKLCVLSYDASLTDAKNLCISEDERRRNLQEDQWNRYASLLCNECEERCARNPLSTQLFLYAVRDVLKAELYPTLDVLDFQDCLNLIRERKNISDDVVYKSINLLKSAVINTVPVIDSKIMLIENSRMNLLNDLTRVSVFDYRSYILRPLKEFLLDGIVDMRFKANLAAVEADLLLEGEEKSQSKKNTNKKKKKTSTRMSSPLDKTVEHEHSVNLEPEGTSPSLKTAEEDSMDPLSRERGLFEISSNTDNQEKAAEDMQNMPGKDSLSEHLESVLGEGVVRCNLALDMTLKALCNIKMLKEYLVHNRHQFPDNLQEQVPCALQNFFTAFVSKQIKEEGLYNYLLEKLLASLEEVGSMSIDAAELLVSILEFWPCWKSPERESLVTCLLTLEEYERMSCSKCRRKPNYPEQSSYGVVMTADSVRDLKCAFENINFEDILKVIRMEDQMLCDIKTGGCGKANFVHHIISRCPPIFTVVLEWEKDETEKEISETTKALDWEIDISRLYEGLEPKTKYRLVSMVGCGEEEEYICLAYKKNRWVSFRHKALAKEAVGNWKSVVRFCGEKKIRPEILFYEAAQGPEK